MSISSITPQVDFTMFPKFLVLVGLIVALNGAAAALDCSKISNLPMKVCRQIKKLHMLTTFGETFLGLLQISNAKNF